MGHRHRHYYRHYHHHSHRRRMSLVSKLIVGIILLMAIAFCINVIYPNAYVGLSRILPQISATTNPYSLTTTIGAPTEQIYGVATAITTSGNGGTATLLTSDNFQTTISWANNENIPNPSFYLNKLCRWSLSGSTLISVNQCSQ